MKNKEIQLFLFPYAGGSAASFKRLTDLLDERVDAVTVEYAGRGTRAREPLAENIRELFDDAARYIGARRNADLPYALMGYSMGSILAYEMLAQSRIPGSLKHLFLAAEVSPKERALELRKIQDPTDEKILERARQLGGLDEKMMGDQRFARIYLAPMLSDYRLFFEYRFAGYKEKVRADTTVFYCEEDTPFADVSQWRELVEGTFDFHEMGENHFFLNRHYREMAGLINVRLGRYMGGDAYDV